jgi:glucokinase
MNPPARGPEPLCLALDIGGTKIDAAVVAPSGEILSRARMSTIAHAESLFDDVTTLIGRVRATYDVGAIGVGCGGPMNVRTGVVSPLNIPAWREFALRDALESATSLPVAVDNDAKALALAEGRFGAARGLASYISMVVSTGVGGGIVLNGQLLDGSSGNAGHIGHVIVEPGGRLCPCGTRGCLEAEASGTSIAEITGRPAQEAPLAVRRRTGEMVARAVTSAAALLDVQRCFVAGSVALGFGDDFFSAANDAVRDLAHIAFIRTLEIEPTGLPDDGPLLGAATVAWRAL